MPQFFVRFSLRSAWLKLHFYLALLFGLLFSLQGLTGSLIIYRDQIDHWLMPHHTLEPNQAQPLSLDQIIAAVRAAHPDRHGVWTLELPRSKHDVLLAWFEKPRETFGAFYAPLMVAVNHYTGEIIDNRFWGQTAITWLIDLHTHLHLQADGRKVVAFLGVMLCLSVGSGLYLWWPGWRKLHYLFKLQINAGRQRLLLDLHKLLGTLAAAMLLVLAFTGSNLAYPNLIETITASEGMGHGEGGPNVRSTALPNDKPISLTQAVLVARGPFPQSQLRRVSTPQGESGTYKINLRQANEINQHHPITTVWVDRWSGQIRDVRNPNLFKLGQTFSIWLWPLHTGEALGDLGRLLWFFTGFMPLLLYVSGIYYWLHRRGFIKDRPIKNRIQFKSSSRPKQQFIQVYLLKLRQNLSRWLKLAWRNFYKYLNPE